jgi:putative ABC transport system permease protein
LDEEIRAHIDMAAREREERGEAAGDARAAARRDFGNVGLVKETTREMWGWASIERIWQDVRYGLRVLRKNPGFTAVAVLTLALGIGASTAMFSAIDHILLNPYSFPNAKRMVSVRVHDTTDIHPGGRTNFVGPEFLDYVEQSDVFEAVQGSALEDVLYTMPEGTRQYRGGLVTTNTYDFFGTSAIVGRVPTAADVKPGAPPVFAMTYKTWVKDFGQDPSIVGKSFILNDVPTILVGILPPRFSKLDSDLLFPVNIARADPQTAQDFFQFQALLKPGISLRQAQAELSGLGPREAKLYPRYYPKEFAVEVVPLIDGVLAGFRATMYTLAAAVGLLLLIACSNVANMLLAQASAREKEMSIRAALGASRWRIVRQLLIESLLLALGGATVGSGFAYWGIKGIIAAMPPRNNLRDSLVPMDLPVLLFALGAAVGTAILFGLVPAWQTARRDIVEPLKDSGHGVGGGFRRGKFRSALVVVEVALSIVLMVAAGVMMRSFVKLVDADLGFNPNNILVARIPFPKGRYTTAAAKRQFFSQLLQRVAAMPGVVSATETAALPPYGGIGTTVEVPGKVHSEEWRAIFNLCSEGFSQTLGLRLLRGRFLSDVEVNGGRKVAVVNQTLVTKYFGQDDPIGREIKLDMLGTLPTDPVTDPEFEIVGVTEDEKNQGLEDPPVPEVFIPYTVTGAFQRGILVKTTGDPAFFVNTVQHEIWDVDRSVAVTMTQSLSDYLNQYSYSDPRFVLTLLGIFSGLGLVLVALGVYTLTAYTVSRQTHEIGIRMALGAAHADVLRMVMWMGLQLVGLGVAAGLLASFATTRLIASQLADVSPHDPLTLAGVAVMLFIVGCAACYFPARRATRVDPMVALRYE